MGIFSSTVSCDSVITSTHVLSRLFERAISYEEMISVIENGEVIENYPNDKPYPSMLLLRVIRNVPIHVVLARETKTKKCIVVTAYFPDRNIWSADFKSKKNKKS